MKVTNACELLACGLRRSLLHFLSIRELQIAYKHSRATARGKYSSDVDISAPMLTFQV